MLLASFPGKAFTNESLLPPERIESIPIGAIVAVAKTRDSWHLMAWQLWRSIEDHYGSDPFAVAARQGISIILHNAESTTISPKSHIVSRFRLDSMAIDIYAESLNHFWEGIFPGCAISLKYKYACWRELWNFWASNKFAPVRSSLGKRWKKYLDQIAHLPTRDMQYLSHYFACLATGLLECDA